MTRFAALLLLPLLAACATDEGPQPDLPTVSRACAAAPADGLVDPRAPGLLGCANDLNLRAMVADPRDLDRGVGSTATGDELAIEAVRRLRIGEPQASKASDAASSSDAKTEN